MYVELDASLPFSPLDQWGGPPPITTKSSSESTECRVQRLKMSKVFMVHASPTTNMGSFCESVTATCSWFFHSLLRIMTRHPSPPFCSSLHTPRASYAARPVQRPQLGRPVGSADDRSIGVEGFLRLGRHGRAQRKASCWSSWSEANEKKCE